MFQATIEMGDVLIKRKQHFERQYAKDFHGAETFVHSILQCPGHFILSMFREKDHTDRNNRTGSRIKTIYTPGDEIANARPVVHLFPLPPALTSLRRFVVLAQFHNIYYKTRPLFSSFVRRTASINAPPLLATPVLVPPAKYPLTFRPIFLQALRHIVAFLCLFGSSGPVKKNASTSRHLVGFHLVGCSCLMAGRVIPASGSFSLFSAFSYRGWRFL